MSPLALRTIVVGHVLPERAAPQIRTSVTVVRIPAPTVVGAAARPGADAALDG